MAGNGPYRERVGSPRRQPRLGRFASALLRTQPDERLVAMSREGGRAPFAELVRRHRPALIAFAGGVAPPSRAEDVVQESFLKAYAALQDGAEPELLRAWLFRIVRNTAIDEHRTFHHHEQLDENHDGVEQPPQALERREQVAALLTAIRDLPPNQREAIVKRELEGRGHEDIGRGMNLSPGAVRQLIYRARHSLREAAGVLVPPALVRLASLPGADTAAGGVGIAGAAKLGLAAVVATGTIVAGTSIERHEGSDRAEAGTLSKPRVRSESAEAQSGAQGSRGSVDRGRSDNGTSTRHSENSGRDNPAGSGVGGGSPTRDGSGGDGAGEPSDSGEGSGSSGPGGGDDDSSGPGPGGSDDGAVESSGPGGEEESSSGPDDGGSSGSDDGLESEDSSNSGPD
jgi:RNA polymerase sigma factor (sigma-70 family)